MSGALERHLVLSDKRRPGRSSPAVVRLHEAPTWISPVSGRPARRSVLELPGELIHAGGVKGGAVSLDTGMPKQPPQLDIESATIFRLTHVDNVPWILEHGLHCKNSSVQDPDFVRSCWPEHADLRVPGPTNCAGRAKQLREAS